MDRDIKQFVHSCIDCQSSKISRHTESPISTSFGRFQRVHIDIVGPLPPAFLPSQPDPLP